MADDTKILKYISFDKHSGKIYDSFDVHKDFGTWKSWGTIWPFNRIKFKKQPDRDGSKAIKVKYPKGKIRSRDCGASWHCKNFGKHKDLYLSFWVKFSSKFEFRAGGKLHGLCGGKCNTGGDKPNGHDGWSSRIHWGPDNKIKNYVYHKDQSGKYGQEFFWVHNPELIVIEPGQEIDQYDGNKVHIERGVWHHISTRVVVNDIGQRNGFIQTWLNGELVLNVHGFEFRDQSCSDNRLLVDDMYFSTFFGGNSNKYKPIKNEYAYFDDSRPSTRLS